VDFARSPSGRPTDRDVWIRLSRGVTFRLLGSTPGTQAYRYYQHPSLASACGIATIRHLIGFARALPRLRRRVATRPPSATVSRNARCSRRLSFAPETTLYSRGMNAMPATISTMSYHARHRHVRRHGTIFGFHHCVGRVESNRAINLDDPPSRAAYGTQELARQHLFQFRVRPESFIRSALDDVNRTSTTQLVRNSPQGLSHPGLPTVFAPFELAALSRSNLNQRTPPACLGPVKKALQPGLANHLRSCRQSYASIPRP